MVRRGDQRRRVAAVARRLCCAPAAPSWAMPAHRGADSAGRAGIRRSRSAEVEKTCRTAGRSHRHSTRWTQYMGPPSSIACRTVHRLLAGWQDSLSSDVIPPPMPARSRVRAWCATQPQERIYLGRALGASRAPRCRLQRLRSRIGVTRLQQAAFAEASSAEGFTTSRLPAKLEHNAARDR